MITATSWKLIEPEHWPWKDFSPYEMSCRGDGSLKIDERLMDALQAIRAEVGFPMPVSSGYRSPEYNKTVSDTGEDGPHTKGQAVDIQVSGANAVALLKSALAHGIRGIGVSQRGNPTARVIHLDICENGPGCPRPTAWSY